MSEVWIEKFGTFEPKHRLVLRIDGKTFRSDECWVIRKDAMRERKQLEAKLEDK